jgi:hypothetical protein
MPEQNKKKIPFEQRLAALNLTDDDFYALVKMGATLVGLENKRHPLCVAIYNKLKQRKEKANFLYSTMLAIKAKKYAGTPNDKITNPLAISEYGSKPLYTNVEEKRIAFELGVEDGMVAYTGFQKHIPLGGPGAEFNDVEYIAGLWRVQHKIPYEITNVRDRQFVLVEKLPRTEKNKFEYYRAALATWGGTGCSANVSRPDWIVAKYETPRGTFMSYGQTIEQARAFLAISIYDEYQDLIHTAAFEKQK